MVKGMFGIGDRIILARPYSASSRYGINHYGIPPECYGVAGRVCRIIDKSYTIEMDDGHLWGVYDHMLDSEAAPW